MSNLPIHQQTALNAFNKAFIANMKSRMSNDEQLTDPMLSHTRALIESGYDINVPLDATPGKLTLLGALTLTANPDSVDLALVNGAKTYITDKKGDTPYQLTQETLALPDATSLQRELTQRIQNSLRKEILSRPLQRKFFDLWKESFNPKWLKIRDARRIENAKKQLAQLRVKQPNKSHDYLDYYLKSGKKKLNDRELDTVLDELTDKESQLSSEAKKNYESIQPDNSKQIIGRLITKGISLDKLYTFGNETKATLLHSVAENGYYKVVRYILEKRGELATIKKNSDNRTPQESMNFEKKFNDDTKGTQDGRDLNNKIFDDFQTVERNTTLFKKMPYLYKKYGSKWRTYMKNPEWVKIRDARRKDNSEKVEAATKAFLGEEDKTQKTKKSKYAKKREAKIKRDVLSNWIGYVQDKKRNTKLEELRREHEPRLHRWAFEVRTRTDQKRSKSLNRPFQWDTMSRPPRTSNWELKE